MKYKVLKEFVLNGITQKENTIIQLDYIQSNLKSIAANIEKMPDTTPLTGTKESVLNTITPGETLTVEQKEKLAAENTAISAEAHKLASEQLTRDIAEGREAPAEKAIAEIIKDKLLNEEFETKDSTTNPVPINDNPTQQL